MNGPQPGQPASNARDVDRLIRSFADDAELILLALRHDGEVAYVSDAIERVLGRVPAECIGDSALDWIHPDEIERAVLQMSATADNPTTSGTTRFKIQHADGSWKTIELFGANVTDGTEDYIGIYARGGENRIFVEDVMALLIDKAPRSEVLAPVLKAGQWGEAGSRVGISYWDGERFVQVANDVPDELVGGGEQDGSPWGQCRNNLSPVQGNVEDLDPARRIQADAVGLGQFWIEPVVWADDQPAATVTIWSSSQSGSGPSVNSYGMDEARYLTELILRWTQQTLELDRASRQLVAQEKLASLGTLTAGVAHEIRNPLSFVKNFAEGGEEDAADLEQALSQGTASSMAAAVGELRSAFATIAKHAERIDAIVTNMLGYSRAQAGPPQRTNIGDLVATFVDLGYQGYRGSGHPEFIAQLVLEKDEKLMAKVWPQEVGRVIVNLVANACDAMEAVGANRMDRSPELIISIQKGDECARIAIKDNGTGVPDKVIDHIFEPFFTTKPPGQGTGLGLSLCHDIVVGLHGGELLVESEPGQSTTFTIELPLEPAGQ